MPLKTGKSKETVSANISELLNTFAGTGRIGTSAPPNVEAAQKQATAIALQKARRATRAKRPFGRFVK